jgi:hypothetical protein
MEIMAFKHRYINMIFRLMTKNHGNHHLSNSISLNAYPDAYNELIMLAISTMQML